MFRLRLLRKRPVKLSITHKFNRARDFLLIFRCRFCSVMQASSKMKGVGTTSGSRRLLPIALVRLTPWAGIRNSPLSCGSRRVQRAQNAVPRRYESREASGIDLKAGGPDGNAICTTTVFLVTTKAAGPRHLPCLFPPWIWLPLQSRASFFPIDAARKIIRTSLRRTAIEAGQF